MNVSGSERTITGTGVPDESGAPAKDRFVRRLCDGTTAAAAAPPPQPLWRLRRAGKATKPARRAWVVSRLVV